MKFHAIVLMAIPSTSTVLRFLFLFFEFMQTFSVIQSHMERQLIDDSGFINIDCGLPGGVYNYQPNGLYYTSDGKYISTGNNFQISSTFYKTDPQDLYTTLRSFPEGRRNCYTLSPLKPNNKYLIRARFMYGNYDGQNSPPAFDVYIGVNFWFTVSLRSTGLKTCKGIIHVATTDSIDLCLVNTGLGTPFISALELRPLDNSSYPASPTFSLDTWVHDDIGSLASTTGAYELFGDVYDRLWYRSPTWLNWKVISTNESVDVSQDNPCKVPSSLLMNAGEQNNGLANLTTQYKAKDPTTQLYAYWYFAEIELLGPNETREFNIFVPHGPGYKFGPIAPKYLQLITIASPRISIKGPTDFVFTLSKTDESKRYPILNGIEVYTVLKLPASPTNQEDVDAVIAIKDKYEVPRIWQGDPCLPIDYQWDGLNCTYDGNNPPRITSLSLSSSSLTGEIPPSLSKLTSLKYLNLSNNAFTGKIPEFLAYLPSLNSIDLTGNNLMGPVPQELVEKARNKSIDLRLEGNPDVCKSYPCEVNKTRPHFIVPMVACVATISLLVMIGVFLLSFIRRKKKRGLVDRATTPKNKQFNSSDIVRITDGFGKVIGKGGFGTVYYGTLHDETEVAVKVLSNTSSTVSVKQFCAEAELLTRIHHVNLVSLIGYCDEPANMALVYEYMSCGNLQMNLSERTENPLSWKARLQISVDAAQGLEYLHSGCKPPIIHRDIKPANILLDEMGHSKISDFGLSRYFTANSQGVSVTDLAGTRGYLDPEYCQLYTLSEKSDVYAFGIVLLQLLTGQPTFIKDTNHEDIHIINWVSPMIENGDILAIADKRLDGDLSVNSAWKYLEIALECVKPTGNQRPRISEVVADLKVCYHENYSINLNQALDSGIVSLPSAR